MGEALPDPGALAKVDGPEAAVFVNSLSEIARGRCKGSFAGPAVVIMAVLSGFTKVSSHRNLGARSLLPGSDRKDDSLS